MTKCAFINANAEQKHVLILNTTPSTLTKLIEIVLNAKYGNNGARTYAIHEITR